MKYFVYCRKSQEAEDRQVMSLESQRDEINKIIASDPTIEIIDIYEEAYSAKNPGRALFDEMIKRIEKGHAQGIISWHPDRLARNSMDGGKLIHLLDLGKLTDFKFCTHTFENTPHGKFMLGFMFSNSKYYSDNLSVNVKRGNATKIKNGWLPNLAPIGYRNCKNTATIKTDPKHFKAVRKMYDLLLSNNYSPAEIHRIVVHKWGYKTPIIKTRGGNSPALSTVYRLLNNPFYAGYIQWNGQLHEGKHTPVISKQEYLKAQQLMGVISTTRAKTRSFAYTGLLQCGACGLTVTAEHKTKPSGRQYVYYHCTRVHRTPKCVQPSINEKVLDEQVARFLDEITISKSVHDCFIQILAANENLHHDLEQEQYANQEKTVAGLERQITNLTDLRLREMISDDEFEKRRNDLNLSVAVEQEKLGNYRNQQLMFEPIKILGMLNVRAKKWFSAADKSEKRKILKILCSNPKLIDKKTILEAKKPFRTYVELLNFPTLLADVEDVGTRNKQNSKLSKKQIEQLKMLYQDQEMQDLCLQVKSLIRKFEPELLNSLSGDLA